MTREEFNQLLALDEYPKLKAYAIEKGKKELIPSITGVDSHIGLLSYDQLAKLQTYLLTKFHYVSDDWQFNEDDLWDTTVWAEAILCDDFFDDDCDGFGYAVLGILYYVFGYSRNQLERVACRTETKEGHFVCWVPADTGVIYQMENRVKKPRSVKYMRDLGYEYWHYSKMTNVDRWFNAEKRASQIIYNTPNNLESDKAEFSIAKALRVDKSKHLVKGWFQTVAGVAISIKAMLLSSAGALASTVQMNKHELSQIIDLKYIGLFITLLGILDIYIRTVTNKDVNAKRSIDE
jgi:hypothetical protein